MEREKELAKLINVLRRTARMAIQAEWTGGKEDAASFCVDQYNRVLARLKEIDPGMSVIFEPLPAGSSFSVVAVASRQLGAYYEDEVGQGRESRQGGYGYAFDPRKFREFWERSGREFEDIGEYIRESIDEWLRHKKSATHGEKSTHEEKGPSEGAKQT
ncbi:MAG: hypothetical protein LC794_18570 [Acidobacteria bacterium]|nr:hypothetical protein [Acidobacteriota bacterium]